MHQHPADMYKLPHKCGTPPPTPNTHTHTHPVHSLSIAKLLKGWVVERSPFL